MNFFISANVFGVIPNGVPIAKTGGNQPFRFAANVNDMHVEISRTTTDIEEPAPFDIPSEFRLYQNYPNPFNPETTIRYQLPQVTNVRIDIHNMLGQLVRKLVSESKEAGFHEIIWDAMDNEGKSMSSGVYLYRIQADDFTEVKKLMLLR